MGNKNLTRHIVMARSQWLGLGQNVNHDKYSFDGAIRYRVMGSVLLLIGLLTLTGFYRYSNRFVVMVVASVCLLLGNLLLINALVEFETVQKAINLQPIWERLAFSQKVFETENTGDKMREVIFLGTFAEDPLDTGIRLADLGATSSMLE